MKTPTTPKKSKSRMLKFAYYVPLDLYEAVSVYVDRHRNAPEKLTINRFVREALEAHLSRALTGEKKKAA